MSTTFIDAAGLVAVTGVFGGMASSLVCAPLVFVCRRGRWMAASGLDAMPGELRRRPRGHRIYPKV